MAWIQSSKLWSVTSLIFTLQLIGNLVLCHEHLLKYSNVDNEDLSGFVTSLSVHIELQLRNKSLITIPITSTHDISRLSHSLSSTRNLVIILRGSPEIFFTLLVQENSFILTKNLLTRYYLQDEFTHKPYAVDDYSIGNGSVSMGHFYTGTVEGFPDSIASIHIHDGIFGTIDINSRIYEIIPRVGKEKHSLSHALKEEKEIIESSLPTGPSDLPHRHRHLHQGHRDRLKTRHRRAADRKPPTGSNADTKYIELYLVLDYGLYSRFNSVPRTIIRGVNIMNYVSSLYKQLNIFIALVGIEVWNERNMIDLQTDMDSGTVLNNFIIYRKTVINLQTNNDNAQLVTGYRFSDVIGKGSTGSICGLRYSAAVTSDTYDGFRSPATTLAHELGHNLGLPHDDGDEYNRMNCKRTCPAQPHDPAPTDRCIMYSSGGVTLHLRWSECTHKFMEQTVFKHEDNYCLENIPEQLYQTSKPICGNFFIEGDEECDCGLPGDCTNQCCNPSTCKIETNATCAGGSCCNLDTCQLRPLSYPCRPNDDSECDLAEYCDGKTEWCPDDSYKHDGVACTAGGQDAYCYNGACISHQSQCKALWGENTNAGVDQCYNINTKGLYYGHCGYTPFIDPNQTIAYTYKPCEPKNQQCGVLRCDPEDSVGTFEIPHFLYRTYYYRYHGLLNGKEVNCFVQEFDVGYQGTDPGMTPNGAKCGDNKMCIDQTCYDILPLPETCDCNGNGVCDQNKNCYCDMGWAPPLCKNSGAGGSSTSNPPVQYGEDRRLLAGLLSSFGVLVLIVIIGVAVYCRRTAVKNYYEHLKFKFELKTGNNGSSQRKGSSPATKPKRPVQKEPSSTALISGPVLQSTTNEENRGITLKRLMPSRDAPSAPVHKTPTRDAPRIPNPTKTPTRNAPPPPAVTNKPHTNGKLATPPVSHKPIYITPVTPPIANKPKLYNSGEHLAANNKAYLETRSIFAKNNHQPNGHAGNSHLGDMAPPNKALPPTPDSGVTTKKTPIMPPTAKAAGNSSPLLAPKPSLQKPESKLYENMPPNVAKKPLKPPVPRK